MGDNEIKIVYSPEEQQEIERILNYLSQETLGYLPADKMPSNVDAGIKKQDVQVPEEDFGMSYDDEETAVQERYDDFPEEMGIQEQDTGEEEEIQDITDLIQEIKDKSDDELQDEISKKEVSEDIPFAEETEEEPSFEPKPVTEEDLLESIDLDKEDTIKEAPDEQPEFDMSMVDEELEEHQDEFQPDETESVTEPQETAPEIEEEKEPLLDEDMLKEFDAMDSAEIADEKSQPDKGSDIETAEEDFLDMDMAEISPTEELYPKTKDEQPSPEIEAEFPSIDDLEDLQEMSAKPDENLQATEKPSKEIHEADISTEFEEISKLDQDETPISVSPEMNLGESIEEDFAAAKNKIEEKPGDEIDLSDKELKKLNKVIQLFHPNLIKIIKDVIVNDLLSALNIRNLVDMIISGKQEEEIKIFLERKLNKKIDTSVKPGPRRRVIAARPEYTKEGRERQKRLLKATGIFAISAVVISIITIFAYQYAYIPFMAKRNIDEGVRFIKKPVVSATQKQDDYKKAEEIFHNVNENYIRDYLYGYHSYGKAYFQNKEYDYALEKLNKAYDINAADVDTLNNLGFFYAKVPEAKFEQIKPELQKYYYKKIKPAGPISKPVDVAIDFYRKALNMDSKNITALYGIGNAYTHSGEYTKAKQYYQNILSVDKESIIGHSGLLNLYIERNALPEVITIHYTLANRKNLPQVPSALLAKLASYYLTKKRTDENNIRIDHGSNSPIIKDINDNPYPAVKNVLDALAARDINYPPLFVQFARLSREEKNYNLMKRNLLTALEKEPNYFAAHVLLAEYYYFIKDFVEAYKSSKKALQTYLTPPEFTNDDFYYETQKIGTAYAVIGNIFYYSDKVKFRFGDEFAEETTQEKSDELANFGIAQEKYEKALAENYKSSEVFYNLGRIYYVKGQYDKATTTWLNLYEDFTAQPELLLALGNSFYHQNNLEASKGEYLKVISIFESKTDNITQIFPSRAEHVKFYLTLSSAYNNLGAVYQKQNNEAKSNISYWKAVDYAKRIERENEFARQNLARAFKTKRENILPVLDENIADSIDMYKELK